MKHVFIINPAAGKGDSENKILPMVIRYVKEHGDDFEIHRTLSAQEVTSYVKARAAKGDPIRFYAVGGDGTVCDVVSGMAEYGNAELAVIPCGSGNDFVKNFTHTENFLNLDKQVEGSIEYVDVIKYNDLYSMNMLNAGADCDVVAKSMELRRQGAGGVQSYIRAALDIIPKGPEYAMEYINENGEQVSEKLMLAAIGNGMFCGGGFKSCPDARINDGLMDIALVKPVHGLLLGKLLLEYRLGTYVKDKAAQPYFKYIQASEFYLKPLQEFNVSVDGEIHPFEEAHIKVIPRAVKVVIPKGSALVKAD